LLKRVLRKERIKISYDIDYDPLDDTNALKRKKNNFAKVSKNLATDLKIILLDYQNNYIGCLSWLLKCQHFLHHYSCLNFLHNYFDGLIKLFSDLYRN